jgi:enoyl-CoA hydratase
VLKKLSVWVEVQEVVPTPEKALEAGIAMATKIAACGPLGIKTTLTSAHLAIDGTEAEAPTRALIQTVSLALWRRRRKLEVRLFWFVAR